jgi:hypothetical protein
MSKSLVTTEAKQLAVVANHALTQAVTAFGQYVDPAGNAATSPAGLMKSFNSAVKREFGLSISDMPEDMQMHVGSLRLRVAKSIEDGMASNMLRTDIKRMIREAVKVSAQAYLLMTGANHEQH